MRWNVGSPDGVVSVTVELVDGSLRYAVHHGGTEVVVSSALGITTATSGFESGLSVESVESAVLIEEVEGAAHGRRSTIEHRSCEITVHARNPGGKAIDVVVRAFGDGAAFRYRGRADAVDAITAEATEFALAADGRAWKQAMQPPGIVAPAYELPYVSGIRVGHVASVPGWALPALFEVGGKWVLLTEADLDDGYFGAHLDANPHGRVYRIDLPQPAEGRGHGAIHPTVSGEWQTPWRVIVIGDSPGVMIECDIVDQLSRPNAVGDTSWVTPGRVSWSWWSDHDSPRDADTLREFIDFSAEMGWEYTLIDANWNELGDEAIQELVSHAASRDVGVFLWYNSGGPHNIVTEQPRDRMYDPAVRRAEFAKLASWGVRGVKVDFFHSDKQLAIQLYLGILRDAAEHQLMVNFHGSTVPRGWSRTYPHLMTMEGVWGAEQYDFAPDFAAAAPAHNTVIPFTRNAVGPMDYTPVTFSDVTFPHITTNAHELALSVVFESGLQHFADSVSSYRSQPPAVIEFLRNVPAAWDETRYLGGEPSEYVVIARRRGDAWFIGGINGTPDRRTVDVPVEFLPDGAELSLVLDAGPREFTLATRAVHNGQLAVEMDAFGGFAARSN